MDKKEKEFNFNFNILDEFGKPLRLLSTALIGSFMRIKTEEEHIIEKIDIFITKMKEPKPFSLDPADYKLFKRLVLKCDSIQLVKSSALKVLNGD